jgi:hypothetical protein
MRLPIVAVLLLAAGASVLRAQEEIHEYRPEIIVTLPRWHGYGLWLLHEQHLGTGDLAPNERIQGVALLSPVKHRSSLSLELRQVSQPQQIEHRWIPTLNTSVALPAGFELRDRARVEIRDVGGKWSRRYQNRATVGHLVDLAGTALFPYGAFDASYDSRYARLNRRETMMGVRVPLGGGTSLDSFVTRQIDDRRAVRVLVATGAILRVVL